MSDPICLDRTAELKGQPGVHAFIVGVSEYENLPNIDSTGDPLFKMTRLASPALSAYRFHSWLMKTAAENKLVHPLKSCRVLLSPSAKEREVEPKIDSIRNAGKAMFAEFAEAATFWRAAASSESHDITIFYFCGHGLWSSPTETILALADVLAPPASTPLVRCVDFANLKKGMAPQEGHENIALTQLYFIDCCRNHPEYLQTVTDVTLGKAFDIKKNTSDHRKVSVYYSTIPGKFAVGRVGRESIFCEALLHALHAAVDKERAFNDGIWAVMTDHLKRAIERYFSNNFDERFDELPPEAVAARAIICYLPGPPRIDLTIGVNPPVAAPAANIVFTSVDEGDALPAAPDQNGSTLWRAAVRMGMWRLDVSPGVETHKTYKKSRYVDYDIALPWKVNLDAV
jgi:Caspase domain